MQELKDSFVHAFETPNFPYLYDVNTNSILRVSPGICDYMRGTSKNALTEEDIRLIGKMRNEGFLKKNPLTKIEHQVMPVLNNFLDQKIQGITFQITQQCNLRCKYCVYSGDYITRGHAPKSMSVDLAKRGIDFVMEHSSSLIDTDIGFYGGEPLLRFNDMKEIVAYASSISEGKIVRYNVTTNGTIMNDEILTFLDEHKFTILISLDGPKEIHDQNRVFAANGKGSFDAIMDNIRYMKEKYPSLYARCAFNAVLDPTLDLGCASQFFLATKELEGANVMASIISDEYRKSDVTISEQYKIEEEVAMFKLFMNRFGRLDKKYVSPITEAKFARISTTMFTLREISPTLPPVGHPSGPCIPGARKLFMNVEGTFYPCEKVSEGSKNTIIGNIDDGFDLERIAQLVNIGSVTEQECLNCWGFRLCPLCMLSADDTEMLSKEVKIPRCKNALYSNEHMLKDYCTLIEYGFRFEDNEVPIFVYEKEFENE